MPILLDGDHLDSAACALAELRGSGREAIADWPFAPGGDNIGVADATGRGHDGLLVNMPTRAVLGSNWDRETFDWRSAPEQYGAIHFHEDDITDANWTENVVLTLPADTISGVYALKVSCSADEDYIPFFVRPAKPTSKIALLIPTASYLAYANTRRGTATRYAEASVGRPICLTPGEVYAHDHPELGSSLYDSHRDGSGCHFSSFRRPVLNMRPKATAWLGATGSALWQFNADLHIVDWLFENGIDVDIITDHDLDRQGASLLASYTLVLSGSHPEYSSSRMLDAIETHVLNGGAMLYLGGNGFYHRVEFDVSGSGTVEARRHGGSWTAPTPERHFQCSGNLGGAWSHLMRSAEDLFGIMCVAEGYERSSYYRRHPISYSPPFDQLFRGVDNEIVGDFGLIGGGAAGLEVDRVVLGSSLDAEVTILASSEKHGSSFVLMTDLLSPNIEVPGGSTEENEDVRADIVLVCHANGGCVFSVGSMTWAASLSHNGYKNSVSAITRNAIELLSQSPGSGRLFSKMDQDE